MIEGHLDLAQRMAARVDAEPTLERLADGPLSVVCFRFAPADVEASRLDALNTALADGIQRDGRFAVGATEYAGRVALRPTMVNWRTRDEDVDGFIDVVLEIASQLLPTHNEPAGTAG
jgi:glutamate/tyrosine decarboxylase-like PLP-dependent enzyme